MPFTTEIKGKIYKDFKKITKTQFAGLRVFLGLGAYIFQVKLMTTGITTYLGNAGTGQGEMFIVYLFVSYCKCHFSQF
jgi:hypothetical protein